jgi:hypothetical protein
MIFIITVPAEQLILTVKDIEERRLRGRFRGGGCKNEKAGDLCRFFEMSPTAAAPTALGKFIYTRVLMNRGRALLKILARESLNPGNLNI